MNYPIASIDEDAQINPKMAARSLVALLMRNINAIAAYYDTTGFYYFMFANGSICTTSEIREAGAERERADISSLAQAVDALSLHLYVLDYPPGRPILDPIYFGT